MRAAAAGDAAAVAALCAELGYPIPESQARDSLAVQTADAVVLVAERDGAGVIGWIEAARRRSVETAEIVEILGLVVTAGERGRDVGSALLAAAEAWARERGIPVIRVRSNVTRDRTHGFYRTRGYTERKRQVVFDKPLPAPEEISR